MPPQIDDSLIRKDTMSPTEQDRKMQSPAEVDEAPKEDTPTSVLSTESLIVRLKFTGKNKSKVQDILRKKRKTKTPAKRGRPPGGKVLSKSASRDARKKEAPPVEKPTSLSRLEKPFKRPWVDETYHVDVKVDLALTRDVSKKAPDYGMYYKCLRQAVPVDAVFPPGVIMTAKEIMTFYPYHVRWYSVLSRLIKNGYRADDIVAMQIQFRKCPSAAMKKFMFETIREDIKSIERSASNDQEDKKMHRSLRTDHLERGPLIQMLTRGKVYVPTFEDLVRGLKYIPCGGDTRDLTQCLKWYLDIRDTFTTKLSLNVLHIRALVQALRQPLRALGPQNLDRLTLREWRTDGKLRAQRIEAPVHQPTGADSEGDHQGHSTMHVNLTKNSVKLNVSLSLRHVLTFPLLALHGVVGEAFTLGISKAEARKEARKEARITEELEERAESEVSRNETIVMDEMDGGVRRSSQQSQKEPSDSTPTSQLERTPTPYLIHKRPRSDSMEYGLTQPGSKRARVSPDFNPPMAPRAMMGLPMASAAHHGQPYTNLDQQNITMSTHSPPVLPPEPRKRHHDPVYGRR